MLLLNMIFSFCLLLACIIPYTSSASLAFVSLAVPLLVFVNILFFIYWVLRKKFYFLLSLSILVYGYLTLGTFIGFNSINKTINNEDSITIMSFNSLGFRGKLDDWKSKVSDSIVTFIREENPDIICFQEFDQRKIKESELKEYNCQTKIKESDNFQGGKNLAIYSKYRVLNNGRINFEDTYNGAIFIDVVINKDTIRIYNLHMESFGVRPYSIKYERSDLLLARLRVSFSKQQNQARLVRKHMNNSPYKIIVCGDFNNTQFSNSYFTIKGDLKDSFLEKGRGYGKTINFWKFPFRIDYILVDPAFEVLSHKNYGINLSDHEPIMAAIKIPTE